MKATLVSLALCCLLGSCVLPDIGGAGYVGYMNLTPSGNFGLQDSGKVNNVDSVTMDIDRGFDIGQAGTPFIKAEIELGDWVVTGSAFQYDETGSTVLTRDFGNLQPLAPVMTDLTVANVKLALAYNLIDLEVFDLGAGVAVDYFDVNLEVLQGTTTETLAFDEPAPMPYVRATAGVGVVSAAVEASWIELGFLDGSYFDLDAMVSVNALPFVELVAGYRNALIDRNGDSGQQAFDTHFRLSGWYLGGGIRF